MLARESVFFKKLLGGNYPTEIETVLKFGSALFDTVSRQSQLAYFKVNQTS